MNKHYFLLPLCLLILSSCAPTQEPDARVWEGELPQTGVRMTLGGCTLVSEDPVYYATDRLDVEYWTEKPALQTEGVPVVTLYGAEPEEVELRFVENIDYLYLYYDKVMPQPELDYILTQGSDGSLRYRLDTVYNYEFVVTTEDGTDTMIVTCHRDGL